MIRFNVHVDSITFTRRFIKFLKAGDRKAVLKLAAEEVGRDIARHYYDEKDSSGRRWQPLDISTLKNRAKKGYGPYKILSDTGRGKRVYIDYLAKASARIGTSVDYMEQHNNGKRVSKSSRPLPKREWAYVSELAKKRIHATMKKVLQGAA